MSSSSSVRAVIHVYESCACHVSAAPQRKTSLFYSLSAEFVCMCNSPKLLSYRFRRRATLAALHSSYAHTRDVADQVVVPSSCSAPGMVLCCTAAAGLGQWSICSTEPASAARCQRCSQLIIIVQRRWAYGCRTACPCFGPSTWTQGTGPSMRARSMSVPVRASKVRSHADTSRTRLRGPQKH